jgi:hypothetical protein
MRVNLHARADAAVIPNDQATPAVENDIGADPGVLSDPNVS